jgi:fructose-1,6-bisphosphatase/sedoheptulose 1,7-bisphosphatase-like protein
VETRSEEAVAEAAALRCLGNHMFPETLASPASPVNQAGKQDESTRAHAVFS